MHNALRRLKGVYARATGQHLLSADECLTAAVDLMGDAPGLAIGEVHGNYAHARFVQEIIPHAARRGVRRLYVEMFQQPAQPIIDRWQDHGDDSGMIAFINREARAYSEFMWLHYWAIMQAAQRKGIRLVAVEPRVIDVPYPGTEMYIRNDAWSKAIAADQARDPAPYLLYCGQGHLTRAGCGKWQPVQEMLGIPGIFLRDGKSGLAPSMQHADLHDVWLQPAPHQTAIYGAKLAVVSQITPGAHRHLLP